MELLKQAGFATYHGVSRKTVTEWKKRDWLVFKDGLVDVEASNERLKKYRPDGIEPVTQRAQGNRSGNKAGNTKGNTATIPVIPEQGDDETAAQAAERHIGVHGAPWDREEARRIKENYQALLNRLEYEAKAGQLVDLALAESIFYEEFRAQRDAWLNWPIRIAPLLAADLGLEADKVTEVLTAHVHKQISSLGEPEANFTDRNS